MQDLASMKYAELRKLAKSAGIKANQKQEKLVAELTKYFEQKESSSCKNDKVDKTPKSTPKAETKVSSAKKAVTPVVNRKIGTPNIKINTPVRNDTPSKINTPNNKIKPSDKTNTPQNVSNIKTNTPLNKANTPINKTNKTAKINTPNRIGTPNNKINTPKSTPSISTAVNTITNGVKKVETPGSGRSASRWEKKVFSPAKAATKRKQTNTPDQQPAKKRRSTFEKAPTPDLKKPEIEARSTEKRRSGRLSSSSPVVKEMLGAMKSDMNDEEMKSSLLSILDKNVQEKVKTAPAQSSTSIPRFAAFIKNRQAAKPVTPGNKNWDKIHKKNFEKFDSIDVYLEKKRKRAEDMSASAKKAKTLLSEVHSAVNKLKSHKTPTLDENKFVKPRTSTSNKTTPFKPTVLNTTKMNLNFGARPTPKTLPRKSPKTLTESNVNKQTTETRKSTSAVQNRKSSATPFKFTAVNNSTLNSTVSSTKKTFDIKASLARPITWKAHKGKLKPLTTESKSPVYIKTNSAVKATKTAKDRVNSRVNVANRRADKKNKAQMARRGINV
ncbi:Nucleolar and spindle-associated protein 1 [Mactra antiquata]